MPVGENRRQLGHAAYHWAVHISPKDHSGRDCYVYDITNGPLQNVAYQIDRSPKKTWRFREKDVNPDDSQYMVGMIMIGNVPAEVVRNDIVTNLGPSFIFVLDKNDQQILSPGSELPLKDCRRVASRRLSISTGSWTMRWLSLITVKTKGDVRFQVWTIDSKPS